MHKLIFHSFVKLLEGTSWHRVSLQQTCPRAEVWRPSAGFWKLPNQEVQNLNIEDVDLGCGLKYTVPQTARIDMHIALLCFPLHRLDAHLYIPAIDCVTMRMCMYRYACIHCSTYLLRVPCTLSNEYRYVMIHRHKLYNIYIYTLYTIYCILYTV